MDELNDLADPGGRGGLVQLVEGLESEAVGIENLDGDLQNLAVGDASLEVLLGQGLGEVDGDGVPVGAVQHIMNQPAVEHQIAVKKDHVIVNQIPCQVHGVDVIGPVEDVVADEGEVQLREVGGNGLQLILERTGGDDEVLDALCAEDTKLTVQNGLAVRYGSHGLVVGLGKLAHPVAVTGVENNGFHSKNPFQYSGINRFLC